MPGPLGSLLALGPAATVNPCHHCAQPATAQWQRNASDAEREGYWAAMEMNIRSQPNLFDDQNATWTADRTQPVVKAVFGCEEHPDPAPGVTHAADCGGHGECGCAADPSSEHGD